MTAPTPPLSTTEQLRQLTLPDDDVAKACLLRTAASMPMGAQLSTHGIRIYEDPSPDRCRPAELAVSNRVTYRSVARYLEGIRILISSLNEDCATLAKDVERYQRLQSNVREFLGLPHRACGMCGDASSTDPCAACGELERSAP